jgi:hypothetical protein
MDIIDYELTLDEVIFAYARYYNKKDQSNDNFNITSSIKLKENNEKLISYKIISNLTLTLTNEYFLSKILDIYLNIFVPKLRLKQINYQYFKYVDGNINILFFDLITIQEDKYSSNYIEVLHEDILEKIIQYLGYDYNTYLKHYKNNNINSNIISDISNLLTISNSVTLIKKYNLDLNNYRYNIQNYDTIKYIISNYPSSEKVHFLINILLETTNIN